MGCRVDKTGAVNGLPPLTWLKAFESAARTLSFAAAAAELNMSSGAISYQIRALEAHLGFALFARTARGIKLTSLGAAYTPAVRKAFDELAESTIGLFGGTERVKVTVHAPASLAALWLVKQLPVFMALNPRIDIRMSSLVWDNPVPDEAADLEIRYGAGHWDGYRSEHLLHQSLMVVCSPAVLEEARGSGDVASFVQRHLISIVGYEKHRVSMRQGLQAADLPVSSVPTVDTSMAGLELATNDVGCALTHPVLAEPYLRLGRLVPALDLQFADAQSYFICTPQRRERNRREVEIFSDWLVETARSAASTPGANPSFSTHPSADQSTPNPAPQSPE
jgi:LysR family transcriptional regulator, glycine cleavage system transcriptional activator